LQTLTDQGRRGILDQVEALARSGLRAVAVATRPAPDGQVEVDNLVFVGVCAFADPPKPSAPAAIARLREAGVRIRILSGDHPEAVRRIAVLMGLRDAVLTGEEIDRLTPAALRVRVGSSDAFARLTPNQKVRVVRALQAAGEVTGFLGDGINDAPGIKTADVGLSVDGATGVAREAADMILLAGDLEVVADGVAEGRRTFLNILKYVRMGASSNFGNMLSMAAASLFLPFLPMLPIQILLNNLLYDVSEVGIPMDGAPADEVARPQAWNLRALLRFTLIMGAVSSVFDMATFWVLGWRHPSTPGLFQTGWFMESMASQILVIFVIRVRRPFWTSFPHPALAASSLGALAVALALPFSPWAALLGFRPPSWPVLGALAGLVAVYILAAEAAKRWAQAPTHERRVRRRQLRLDGGRGSPGRLGLRARKTDPALLR
jgi:Mg2+-importing ATPase